MLGALVAALLSAWAAGALLCALLALLFAEFWRHAFYSVERHPRRLLPGLCDPFPILFSVAEDAMRAVPQSHREPVSRSAAANGRRRCASFCPERFLESTLR